MRIDVKFAESKQTFDPNFRNLQIASDGGYERGYAEGEAAGYIEGETDGYNKGYTEGVEDTAPKLVSVLDRSITEVSASDLHGATSIGPYAFYKCTQLESVATPSSMLAIGDSAFEECSALSNISLAEGLESIGAKSFYKYQAEKITFPETLKYIGKSAFYGSKLTEIAFPSSLETLDSQAFNVCENLQKVTFKEGLTSIGGTAFGSCRALREVELPNSLTDMYTYAFAYCSKLRKVKFGEGLTQIGSNAFNQCDNLTHIELPKGLKTIGNSAFYRAGYNVSAANAVIYLPEGLEEIGNTSFSNSRFTYVVIPKSVQTIGSTALQVSCRIIDLTAYGADAPFPTIQSNSISMSSSGKILVPIGRKEELSAMTNWSNLASYMVETDQPFVEELEYTLFSNGTYNVKSIGTYCKAELTIPKTHEGATVTAFSSSAFQNADLLEKVVIESDIKSLPNSCFYHCGRLEEIVLPYGLTSISSSCFYCCTSLKSINIPDTVTSIDSSAFNECGLSGEFIFPPKVYYIYSYVLQNNYNLKGIVLGEKAYLIQTGAFRECRSLEYIDLTKCTRLPSLQSIDAFQNCGINTEKGTFEIRVPIGRKAELAAMTNWSSFADNIVEV